MLKKIDSKKSAKNLRKSKMKQKIYIGRLRDCFSSTGFKHIALEVITSNKAQM